MVFEKYGVNGVVYITRRRNKKNLNFKFVSIDESIPMHEALYRLNTVTIGSTRLCAFKAKYSSHNITPKPRLSTKLVPNHPRKRPVFRKSPRDDQPYVEFMAP